MYKNLAFSRFFCAFFLTNLVRQGITNSRAFELEEGAVKLL